MKFKDKLNLFAKALFNYHFKIENAVDLIVLLVLSIIISILTYGMLYYL